MPAIELTAVVKHYHGLRPLRIADLAVNEHEIMALGGLDVPATEVLANLITGAALPDEGVVRVFGQDTATIADPDQWLDSLDRFGIVSDRVALLDGFTVAQNIAIPLTLDIDPLPPTIVAAVGDLAADLGIAPHLLPSAAGAAPPPVQWRIRLARALAPQPRILFIEHPSASIPPAEAAQTSADLYRVVRARRVTAVVVTEDRAFARHADRHLVLDRATGTISRARRGRWFF